MLEYRVADRAADVVVVELRGSLVGRDWTQRFEELLQEQFIDDGVSEIRIDVSSLDAVDRDGLATLMDLIRAAERRGKRMLIKGAPAVQHRAGPYRAPADVPAPSGRSVSRSFPAVPSSLAAVRAFVRAENRAGPVGEAALEDLVLAVSEACTNAVLHSGTSSLYVTQTKSGSCIEVLIRDEGVYRGRIPERAALGEGGRGVLLMTAMVDEMTIHQGTPQRPGTSVRVVKCGEP
jgi:serine/threonine-protein kinase RsbW